MMNEFETGEDYKFLAQLTWPRGTRVELPCKLFLPNRVGDNLRLIFIVDGQNFNRIGRARTCQLLAELGEGLNKLKIIANDVRIGGGRHRSWGEGLDEGYLLGYPQSLQITRRTPGTHSGLSGVFRLTRSRLLEPSDHRILHSDGSMEWTRSERLQFDLAENIRLTFDHEYRYDTSKPNETRMWPELVAKAETQISSASSLEGFLPTIDDLLLLVSLAEGQRCACLEAAWSCGEECAILYRLDRAIPPDNPNHSVNDFLIGRSDFSHYLEICYNSLRTHPQRELLQSALTSVAYDEASTIGEDFLRLFSALESLVLAFRRTNGLEFVIEDLRLWADLRDDIQKYLKSHPLLKGNSDRRRMLYDNLPGLNRVSLRRATEHAASKLGIELNDTWPLFDTSEGLSLTQVRNMLVHGDYFSEPEWGFILTAKSSLQTIAQRFLLTSLGWDYKKSRASYYNSRWYDWREARAGLSQAEASRRTRSPQQAAEDISDE